MYWLTLSFAFVNLVQPWRLYVSSEVSVRPPHGLRVIWGDLRMGGFLWLPLPAPNRVLLKNTKQNQFIPGVPKPLQLAGLKFRPRCRCPSMRKYLQCSKAMDHRMSPAIQYQTVWPTSWDGETRLERGLNHHTSRPVKHIYIYWPNSGRLDG